MARMRGCPSTSGRTLGLALALLAGCHSTPFREVDLPADASPPAAAREPPVSPAFRFSVAAIESPRETFAAWSHLFERVGARLGVRIDFVQRRTYREVNDLLASGGLDAALLCTGGFLDMERRAPGAVEVLAVPVTGGTSTYHSLVIVPASGPAREFADLAGKRFAYTDELSFSGRIYADSLLRDAGKDPERFFGATLFTRSHDRSVNAVAEGIVDGAAVHGGIYAALTQRDPSLAAQIRVIHRSPPFGAMPVVAAVRLPPALRARLRDVLLELAADPEAAELLRETGIERFAKPRPGLFLSAARVVEARR